MSETEEWRKIYAALGVTEENFEKTEALYDQIKDDLADYADEELIYRGALYSVSVDSKNPITPYEMSAIAKEKELSELSWNDIKGEIMDTDAVYEEIAMGKDEEKTPKNLIPGITHTLMNILDGEYPLEKLPEVLKASYTIVEENRDIVKHPKSRPEGLVAGSLYIADERTGERHITQNEVARAAGVAAPTVSNYIKKIDNI